MSNDDQESDGIIWFERLTEVSKDVHALDAALRAAAQAAGNALGTLADLVAQARAADVHTALGFDSWGEYLADRLTPVAKALGRDDRRELIAYLREYSELSLREIASRTGLGRGTVARDLENQDDVADVDTDDVDTDEVDEFDVADVDDEPSQMGHRRRHLSLSRRASALSTHAASLADDTDALLDAARNAEMADLAEMAEDLQAALRGIDRLIRVRDELNHLVDRSIDAIGVSLRATA